jgi:hypothetical protein
MKKRPILFSTPMVDAILGGNKTETRRTSADWEKVETGDFLWVRETFAIGPVDPVFGQIYHYKAGGPQTIKYRPCIHMPFAACRIFLQVVSIKKERLMDITEGSCFAEGILQFTKDNILFKYSYSGSSDKWSDMARMPREAYFRLWDEINGKDSHLLNPEVYVIEFKQVSMLELLKNGLC